MFEVYQFAADNGSLGDKINQGLIKLLPKDGDKLQVKNWRPITLLNISYKVIAKLLANRIAKVLDSIISVTQTGFIKGRFILENLVTSWEAMHWAKVDNQNSAMILLDFEKAYDRIEWHFVIAMLKQFGFPDYFCQWVNILFKDSNTCIEINGETSESIPLGRSIRQGCPLAPALYVIAADAMNYILKSTKFGHPIKGISLPNNDDLLVDQFADDTTLFVNMEEENFDRVLSRIELFCRASGAKIAPHKSIILGWDNTPPPWLEGKGWQWSGPSTIVRYLGIPFSLDPSLNEMWNWIFKKVERKHIKWQSHMLSLAGRLQLVQKVLSSHAIYYASTWLFSSAQTNKLEKIMRDVLWSDGLGNRKRHNVRWEWCCTPRKQGGLGIKDLKK